MSLYRLLKLRIYRLRRGCTRSTLTFFQYDHVHKLLVTIRSLPYNQLGLPLSAISCLHVSHDQFSRHLAVAAYTYRTCVLKVWRTGDSSFDLNDTPRENGRAAPYSFGLTETLTDRYQKTCNHASWVIKVRSIGSI